MEDRRGSYYLQTRYGQSHQPNSPNFYGHHQPQLPFHPPPQQFRSSLPPPPAPPPPPCHHPFNDSQFSYNSTRLHHPDALNVHRSDFIVENQSVFRNHQSRVLQPPRTYQQHPPLLPPSIDVRRDLELESSSSRFINEHMQSQRGNISFGSNSRDFRVHHHQIGHSVMNFDDGDGRIKNQRWMHHGRQVMRDVHESFIDEAGNTDVIADSDGSRIVKHYYRSNRDVDVESGKGSSSSREGSYEFNRTPRKSLQKKSALLRIQKPMFRIRVDDRGHHFDDSKYVSSFRCNKDKDKDQNMSHPDKGTGDRVKQGRPVQLDVSFKSNSLVAKAIVTPSADVSDSNLTPSKNAKSRNPLHSNKNKNILSSLPIQSSESTAISDSVVSVAKNISGNDNGLRQSIGETKASGLTGTKASIGRSKQEGPIKGDVSNGGGANVVSGKTSSSAEVKKKKILKKPVKRVVDPKLKYSNSESTKKVHKPAIVSPQPASPELEKGAAVTLVNVADQTHSNETTMMTEMAIVDECAERMASINVLSDYSGRLCSPDTESKRSHSTSLLSSSSLGKTKINEDIINNDSTNYFHAISNTDKDNIKLLNGSTGSDIVGDDDAGKQLCQYVDSLLENNTTRVSPRDFHSSNVISDCGCLSSEKSKILEFSGSSPDMILGYESDKGHNNLAKGTSVSNGITDVGCEQPCVNETGPSVENGIVNQFTDATFSAGSCQLRWSNLGEVTIGNVARSASPTVERLGNTSGSDNVSSHGASTSKQQSPDGVDISFDNVFVDRSLNQMVSEEDNSLNNEKMNMKVDFSQSEVNDNVYTEPVSMVTSACWVDTTLRLSFKDPTPMEFTVSGDDFVCVDAQPCTDATSVLTERSSMENLDANISVCSTANVSPNADLVQKQKKRKLSSSVPESYHSMPMIERPLTAGISASTAEGPSSSVGGLTLEVMEAAVPAVGPFSSSMMPKLQNETGGLQNFSGGECESISAIRDVFEDDGLMFSHSCSTTEDLVVVNVKSICATGFQDKLIADATPVTAGAGLNHQRVTVHNESGAGENMDVDPAEHVAGNGTSQCPLHSELRSLSPDERLVSINAEDEMGHDVKHLPSVSDNLFSLRDGAEVLISDTSDEAVGLIPDRLSDLDCQEASHDLPKVSNSQFSFEKVGEEEGIVLAKSTTQCVSGVSAVSLGSLSTEINLNLYHSAKSANSFSGKTTLPSQNTRSTSVETPSAVSTEISGRKNHHTLDVPRTYPGHLSFGFSSSKNTVPSNPILKPRTWHRTDNSTASMPPENKAFLSSVPTPSPLPKKAAMFQSISYVRKGNSLVRKPTSVAAQSQGSNALSSSISQSNSSGTDEVKKIAGCNTRTSIVDPPNPSRSGVNASFERPRTPPLLSSSKIPNQFAKSLVDSLYSPLVEGCNSCAPGITSDPMTSADNNDVLKSSEDKIKISERPIQTGQSDMDCQTEQTNGIGVSSNANSVTYVKRKLNQLVATSNSCSLPIKNSDSTSILPSDGYYKRRRNQLIRTSAEIPVKPTSNIPDEVLNAEGKALRNITPGRSLTKRHSRKAVAKARKLSKFSLVWTLSSGQLSTVEGDSLHHQRVLPPLFPWKRATSWRRFLPTAAANSLSCSSSAIRKLLLLRKRDTVYTRSKHGFSLRKSKVLSVGGSSLKWSKSIEKRSKKANEEATLAVAEAVRKKREKIGAPEADHGTKNSNSAAHKSVHSIKLHPGERIFRIGSVRYKMDSSRRTLQRISDDESSHSTALKTDKEPMRSYIPRRLVIGKDEYVRIGNGNQLVRDPKKRTRILASEKVRWSLHTARSRLARKRKYCQFFTRFGKCNKDDGKCPYIHDSSKIAVCTKFLNGLCFNAGCKLTHKVIPERMPDCSYYLQGLCSNRSCPYRHVHVNPSASTCEGFLRGYCADGNECRKKHSYVCPAYEATGSCPQGSKCKLHHPKNRKEGKKSKQLREKKNTRGRYFGSMHLNILESGTAASEKHQLRVSDKFSFEGSISDYISLDVSDEPGENSSTAEEQTFLSSSDPFDFELADIDELIKPIRIMNT